MIKLSNFFKKHKGFTIFLIIILILGIARFGAYLYKVQNPNEIYYGADDLFNFELYENIDDADDGNWELTQEPAKLGKIYKSPHSLIPSATLYGFENDPEHVILRCDNPFYLSPLTFMKKQDYGIFDVNCIDQIVVERRKRSPGEVDLVGRIEFTNVKEISSWISLIQDLREGKQKQTEAYPSYSEDLYSVSFYLKEVPHARYRVASIYLDEKIIEPDQTGSQPQYVLPDQFIKMISNAKEIPVTEVY